MTENIKGNEKLRRKPKRSKSSTTKNSREKPEPSVIRSKSIGKDEHTRRKPKRRIKRTSSPDSSKSSLQSKNSNEIKGRSLPIKKEYSWWDLQENEKSTNNGSNAFSKGMSPSVSPLSLQVRTTRIRKSKEVLPRSSHHRKIHSDDSSAYSLTPNILSKPNSIDQVKTIDELYDENHGKDHSKLSTHLGQQKESKDDGSHTPSAGPSQMTRMMRNSSKSLNPDLLQTKKATRRISSIDELFKESENNSIECGNDSKKDTKQALHQSKENLEGNVSAPILLKGSSSFGSTVDEGEVKISWVELLLENPSKVEVKTTSENGLDESSTNVLNNSSLEISLQQIISNRTLSLEDKAKKCKYQQKILLHETISRNKSHEAATTDEQTSITDATIGSGETLKTTNVDFSAIASKRINNCHNSMSTHQVNKETLEKSMQEDLDDLSDNGSPKSRLSKDTNKVFTDLHLEGRRFRRFRRRASLTSISHFLHPRSPKSSSRLPRRNSYSPTVIESKNRVSRLVHSNENSKPKLRSLKQTNSFTGHLASSSSHSRASTKHQSKNSLSYVNPQSRRHQLKSPRHRSSTEVAKKVGRSEAPPHRRSSLCVAEINRESDIEAFMVVTSDLMLPSTPTKRSSFEEKTSQSTGSTATMATMNSGDGSAKRRMSNGSLQENLKSFKPTFSEEDR